MNNFNYYTQNARDYAYPEAKQSKEFLQLVSQDSIKEQFNSAPNREEWCKRANGCQIYYIIQNQKYLFGKYPKLELKFVGPDNGEPTIKLYTN